MSNINGLKSTAVSRCLEKKLLFLGYELPDVLAIFFFLAALNLIFGQTEYKLLLVWAPPMALALALRIVKRGKPDNFLVHYVRFKIRPRALYAFYEPTQQIRPPRIKKEGVTK